MSLSIVVTISPGSEHSNADFSSFHAMMYTSEGKRVMDRLWEETLQELEFAGVRDIVISRSNS